jgi:hypothetical protein
MVVTIMLCICCIKYDGDHRHRVGPIHSGHTQAEAKFIASLGCPKTQTTWLSYLVVSDFKTEFGIDIEYSKHKEHALEMIHGTFGDMYKALPKYCADIEATNLSNIVNLDLPSDNQFKCKFISFNASTMVLLIAVLSSVSTVLTLTKYQCILHAAQLTHSEMALPHLFSKTTNQSGACPCSPNRIPAPFQFPKHLLWHPTCWQQNPCSGKSNRTPDQIMWKWN